MTWEAIGAIGELLGAVAVLITLIYLVKQVSATKSALRQQTTQDVNEMFNAIHNTVASSPELAQVIAKLEAGAEISPPEFVQIRALFIAQTNAFENLFLQAQEVGDLAATEAIGEMVKAYFEQQWVCQYWETYQVYFGEDFRHYVSEVRNKS